MELAEIRKTSILDYLQAIGHSPVRIKYGSAWYLSPLRIENTASFKINVDKNLWFDFGSGEGGDIIGLVMKLYNVNVTKAIEIIVGTKDSPKPRNPVFQDRKTSDGSEHIRINRLQALNNPALIQYLEYRHISLTFARSYLKEAYYTVHGRSYFALGFKNDKGAYELRNSFFKTGSSPKHFTTIPGITNSKTNVFEGFMDFLSCCTYYNRIPRSRTIILNSLSFLPRIEDFLKDSKQVNLYLDNDQAGRMATQKIKGYGKLVIDWAPVIYPGHKDFNEYLMSRQP
ncbi:MAG: toprim domain-containing protein [Bacteroidetes bacterium]|nr:toprim domain-containing protein [Bacteroidota bacterium]